MLRYLSILIFTLPVTVAYAAPADDVWMSVLLDGRKIGSMHTTREVDTQQVVTTQEMRIEIERSGLRVGLSTSETDVETHEGKPLRFESRSKISGIESVLTGVVKADKIEVTTKVGGATQTRSIDWPSGSLLAEGLRLAEEKHGLVAGTRYSEQAFQAENLEAVEVESVVGRHEEVDLPDGKRDLVHIDQTVKFGAAPTKTAAWIDADQNVRKLQIPMLGYDLTMLACSKACATAPNQSTDILVHSLVPASRAIGADERLHGIRIAVAMTDADGGPLEFATTDEQQVTDANGKTVLRIAPIDSNTSAHEDAPVASDTQPNDWLQSTAPEIVKLAKQGVGDARTPSAQMQRLEDFVRGFIRNKDLSVGYASALEVAKNPEGDCTEHAVLLAALGRALGIPTRVVDGLVYVDHYAGSEHVFVPHAWAQAYVDGRWRSFDAALHGFDAGHVALSVGDGDPWHFFAGFNTLGRLRVESIEKIAAANQ